MILVLHSFSSQIQLRRNQNRLSGFRTRMQTSRFFRPGVETRLFLDMSDNLEIFWRLRCKFVLKARSRLRSTATWASVFIKDITQTTQRTPLLPIRPVSGSRKSTTPRSSQKLLLLACRVIKVGQERDLVSVSHMRRTDRGELVLPCQPGGALVSELRLQNQSGAKRQADRRQTGASHMHLWRLSTNHT